MCEQVNRQQLVIKSPFIIFTLEQTGEEHQETGGVYQS